MTINQTSPQTLIQTPIQIAIIGAGLTGLMTADLLEQALKRQDRQIAITIFEKSAGVGRLATRYKKTPAADTTITSNAASSPMTKDNAQQWQFDFGAQYFTAKSADFQTYLQPWLGSGIIEAWHASIAKIIADIGNMDNEKELQPAEQWGTVLTKWTQPRYVSSPKMTTWGRALAQKLSHTTIHYKTRIAPFSQATFDKSGSDKAYSNTTQPNTTQPNQAKTTLVDVEGNELGQFDWVICSAPQDQAIELLANTDFAHYEAMQTPEMLACYTLMLGWQQLADMPEHLQQAKWSLLEFEVADNNNHQNAPITRLGKVFIEHKKPSRQDVLPSVTIHAANDWSQGHVDDDIEQVQDQLLEAAQKVLNWDESTAPAHIDCHRWRYAALKAASTVPALAYIDKDKQWLVTGDWCDEGRIESCFVVAKYVVATLVKVIV